MNWNIWNLHAKASCFARCFASYRFLKGFSAAWSIWEGCRRFVSVLQFMQFSYTFLFSLFFLRCTCFIRCFVIVICLYSFYPIRMKRSVISHFHHPQSIDESIYIRLHISNEANEIMENAQLCYSMTQHDDLWDSRIYPHYVWNEMKRLTNKVIFMSTWAMFQFSMKM